MDGGNDRVIEQLDRKCHFNYHVPMSITIDQAGRIVIPKAIRDELHLVSGTELEVDTSGTEIRLRVADLEPSLIQKRGLLVHHGTKQSDLDISDFLHNEREKRATSITPSPSK